MSAYVGVLEHPYFAVDRRQTGAFALRNLPPGTYTIEAWHERLGTQTQQVTVGRQGIEGCQLHLRTLTRPRPAPSTTARGDRKSRGARLRHADQAAAEFLVLLTTAAAYSLGAGAGVAADRIWSTRWSARRSSPAAPRRSIRCGSGTPIG